jgi:hypothetical protein
MVAATLTPVRIDLSPDPSHRSYAKGGLHREAEHVRKAGREGDSVLIHVNTEELEWLKQNLGPGGINPETGLMEFKPFYKQKWFAPAAAVASMFVAPYLTPLVAGALPASMAGASFLGASVPSIVTGAGLGALTGGITGGAKGALTGGLLGAAGPIASNALFGPQGISGALGFGDTTAAGTTDAIGATADATKNALGETVDPSKWTNSATGQVPTPPIADPGIRQYGLPTGVDVPGSGTTSVGSGLSNVLSGAGDKLKSVAPLLLVGAAMQGMGGSGSKSATTDPSQEAKQAAMQDNNMGTPLTPATFNRKSTDPNVWENYGYGPEQQFFTDNTITAATGRYVRGGGTGTSDSIPARLSDGEYVIDAQTVSMLGDGSSDAGAKRLDAMREEIRRHKGKALAQGKFAPQAKGPLSYAKGA